MLVASLKILISYKINRRWYSWMGISRFLLLIWVRVQYHCWMSMQHNKVRYNDIYMFEVIIESGWNISNITETWFKYWFYHIVARYIICKNLSNVVDKKILSKNFIQMGVVTWPKFIVTCRIKFILLNIENIMMHLCLHDIILANEKLFISLVSLNTIQQYCSNGKTPQI